MVTGGPTPAKEEFDFLLSNVDWRRSLNASVCSELGQRITKSLADRDTYNARIKQLSQDIVAGGMRSMRISVETITYMLVSQAFKCKCKCLSLEFLENLLIAEKTYAMAIIRSMNLVSLLRSIANSTSQRDYVLAKILATKEYSSMAAVSVVTGVQHFVRQWDLLDAEASEPIGNIQPQPNSASPSFASTSLHEFSNQDVLANNCLSSPVQLLQVPVVGATHNMRSKQRGPNRDSRRSRSNQARNRLEPVVASGTRGPLGTKIDAAQDLVKTMQDAVASNPGGMDGQQLLDDLKKELTRCVEDLQNEAAKAVDDERMADFTRISRVVDDVNMAIQIYEAYMERLDTRSNRVPFTTQLSAVGNSQTESRENTSKNAVSPSPSNHSSLNLPGGFELPSTWASVPASSPHPAQPPIFGEVPREEASTEVLPETASKNETVFGWELPPALPPPPTHSVIDEAGKKRKHKKKNQETSRIGSEAPHVSSASRTADVGPDNSARSGQLEIWKPDPSIPRSQGLAYHLPATLDLDRNAGSTAASKTLELEALVNKLTGEKRDIESDIQNLNSRISRMRLELEDKEAMNKELKRDNDKLKRELEKTRLAASDADKSLFHAKEMWLRENSRASSLSASLDEKESILLKRNDQIKDLTKVLDHTQKRLKHLEYLLARDEKTIQRNKRLSQSGHFNCDEDDAIEESVSEGTEDFRNPSNTRGRVSFRSKRNLTSLETSATSSCDFRNQAAPKYKDSHFPSEASLENFNKFRRLLVVDEGILHIERNVLEIGIRSLYDGTTNNTRIFFGNLSNGILEDFSVSVSLFDWNPLKSPDPIMELRSNVDEADIVRWTASPVPSTIVQGQQICQSLILECGAPYTCVPLLTVKFLLPDATPRLLNLQLPFPITKFLTPLRLTPVDFFKRWKSYRFVASEVSSIFEIRESLLSPLSNLVQQLQLEGSLELHFGLDSDPNNLILAGTFPPPGNPSISLSTVLIRFEVGSGRYLGKGRVAVRSDNSELADGTRRVLLVLCANLV
eukprot:Gregarina_sp_Poly_1__9512@NODE_598_length_7261_cov_191_713789_g415_i1_p1_GENE_NODE_598_length_7261_cov_191_713789_g415_i1NODE_598_length_7261_cov_191_713789_g415_i1_p1_ORF_typecomplete_len1023_score168_26Alpha_adaptin_C/PF02296_16/6_8e09HOOK/PF05622_12/3_5e02HOOK/PF05622_12/4e05ATG16/PF08614_11/2_3e03ATG16/PF08614_11/0_0028ATG16/PF08614_11/0_64Yuri_gagarin/PF15934_5/0_91Yuri_gagarin/PF15934_5/61UPF0242/PF06785_11/0_0064Alpha_adaptinC2/PF02883_20/0_028Filament/PF00038_21/54Filament/PF00038_21/0_0